jgi:hypothetical protein
MRRFVLLAVGAIGLLAGVLVLIDRPAEPASAAVIAPAPAPVAEVGLRNELRQLRGEIADVSARVAGAPLAAEEPEAVPTRSARESAARFEQALANRLASEGDDPAWSRATEARIATALRGDAFAGTQLRAARCQRTLCRIQLAHTDPDTQESFLAKVTHTPPFNTRGYIKPSLPGEPAATEVYVARDGHPLPTVE